MPRSVRDGESPFTRTVYQVGCGMSQFPQIRIFFVLLEGLRPATVTIFANEVIERFLLSESLQPSGDNQQFASVGYGHPRTVASFVCYPGTVKFIRLHNRYDFGDGFF